MKNMFTAKNILITGGCGSIGSQIVRELLALNPKTIKILERSESAIFRLIQQEIFSKEEKRKISPFIGDVRDRARLDRVMKDVDIVFHAAAMKHIHLCEADPFEAINTNVIGTQHLVDTAVEHGVECFVGISSDKAVNPTTTMGATKLLGEKIITNATIGNQGRIRFCSVRFGNVLASSGSIIPIIQEQIAESNEVTITDKRMSRFFMSIPDAVSLVLDAAQEARNGEVFVLKMKALKIIDLARVLVEELAPRYGKKPHDITFKYIGARPGEKLHEPLITSGEAQYTTEKKNMFVIHNQMLKEFGIKVPTAKSKEALLYRSDLVPHLSKKEIRAMLYEKKII